MFFTSATCFLLVNASLKFANGNPPRLGQRAGINSRIFSRGQKAKRKLLPIFWRNVPHMPGPMTQTIQNVSDTAFMVAGFRAAESERPKPLFRDPLAAKLVGEHGKKI